MSQEASFPSTTAPQEVASARFVVDVASIGGHHCPEATFRGGNEAASQRSVAVLMLPPPQFGTNLRLRSAVDPDNNDDAERSATPTTTAADIFVSAPTVCAQAHVLAHVAEEVAFLSPPPVDASSRPLPYAHVHCATALTFDLLGRGEATNYPLRLTNCASDLLAFQEPAFRSTVVLDPSHLWRVAFATGQQTQSITSRIAGLPLRRCQPRSRPSLHDESISFPSQEERALSVARLLLLSEALQPSTAFADLKEVALLARSPTTFDEQ